MTSKEALEKICSKCEEARAKQRIRCPFRSISNDYCEAYETIEKELKELERIKENRNEHKKILGEHKNIGEMLQATNVGILKKLREAEEKKQEALISKLSAFDLIKSKKVDVDVLYRVYIVYGAIEGIYNAGQEEKERKLTNIEMELLCEELFDKPKHKDFDAYGQQQCEGDCGC